MSVKHKQDLYFLFVHIQQVFMLGEMMHMLSIY